MCRRRNSDYRCEKHTYKVLLVNFYGLHHRLYVTTYMTSTSFLLSHSPHPPFQWLLFNMTQICWWLIHGIVTLKVFGYSDCLVIILIYINLDSLSGSSSPFLTLPFSHSFYAFFLSLFLFFSACVLFHLHSYALLYIFNCHSINSSFSTSTTH